MKRCSGGASMKGFGDYFALVFYFSFFIQMFPGQEAQIKKKNALITLQIKSTTSPTSNKGQIGEGDHRGTGK